MGSAFRERVRAELIPKLSDVTWHWRYDFLSDKGPEDMMQPLLESYESLKKQFSDDPALVRLIDQEIDSVNEWIAERLAEYDPPESRGPPTPQMRNDVRVSIRLRPGVTVGTFLSNYEDLNHSAWFAMPCGIVWLNRFLAKSGHQTNAREDHILGLDLVSVLVSIFRPNRGDLVDFRDFRDFRRLV